MRLTDLLDISVLRKLAQANCHVSGMPIGIIDAVDGSALVEVGWQDICTMYHRANAVTVERCRDRDDYVKQHLSESRACEYTCRNGLRDVGVPIAAGGQHLATLFLGQFFYEGESPDRAFFIEQARRFGFDEVAYLAALDRVPVFSRASVENILAYNTALAQFISSIAESALRRMQAEEALRESEGRYRLLFQNMLEGFAYCRMIYDEHGRPEDFVYLDVNSAFGRLTGLHDVIGKKVTEAIPGIREAHPELLETYGRVARTGQPERFEIEFRPLGMWLSLSVFGPHPDHFVAVFDDITSRKRAEEELRSANRAKDEFLGMLSHELRNPLAPIRNSLYILDHAEPAGQQARTAREVASRQLTHLTRLVDDLLDVTRIVRGKVELRRKDVDIVDLARRTGEDYRALMHEREVVFALDVPREQVWVDGDETRLTQVIGNLLQNAAKFTPPGGRVTLSVVPQADAVEVCVRDTGSGVEPDLLKTIFEPFVQAKQSLARTEGGLGLALVKTFVELHGGSVAVESSGDRQGAQFTIRLPLLRPVRTAEHRGEAGVVEPRVASRRVLVVEDNKDAAESLADLVEMFGHQVEVAFDGPTAIERASANPPDVLLCDLGLPGMSGYEVALALRSDRRFDHVHLVAVSGYAQPEDRERAVEAGFAQHLAKPPDPAKLEKLLSVAGPLQPA